MWTMRTNKVVLAWSLDTMPIYKLKFISILQQAITKWNNNNTFVLALKLSNVFGIS